MTSLIFAMSIDNPPLPPDLQDYGPKMKKQG